MVLSRPRTIAILGGGLMGAGIAQVFAAAGLEVTIFEPVAAVRDTVRARIAADLRLFQRDERLAEAVVLTDDLAKAVAGADYVTEAAPEKLELKQSIFADLVRHASPTAILASNTSVIPIHRIAAGLPTPSRPMFPVAMARLAIAITEVEPWLCSVTPSP